MSRDTSSKDGIHAQITYVYGAKLTFLFSAGHTFRHKSAGAFGPDLAKKLSQLVKMEKNVMRSMELVSRERMEVAVRVRGIPLARKADTA